MRRADSGPGADRRRPARRRRRHHCAAAGLCTGRDHRAGAGGVDRRPGVPRDASAARPRRCPAQGAGRGRSAGRRGDRPRLGHRPADPPVHGQHRAHRAEPAGRGTRRTTGGTADDDGRCQHRCRCTAAGGGHPARAGRRHRLAQQPAADRPAAAWQGGAGRLLDILLHQLPARDAVRARMGAPLPRPRPGGDRRAHAGVRLRTRRAQRDEGGAAAEGRVPGGAGQPVHDLAATSAATSSAKATTRARNR
ncbi:hypothetical protein G6F50_013731 [Rhizopus delemar]|uniref:Uncharacterized protein n=1 Tax=Rhizopus delemar TaxID=936053 RepID=A0A9P6YDE6_9FUNG|nr:hypothetical protein G6F50_013731 [Rhizopus delemar]